MMKTTAHLLFIVIFCISTTYAQVGINADNSAPHTSAMLDVKSTTKAFYPPRMTTAQKNTIVSPQAGAVVFDNTLNQLSIYNGSAWVATGGSSFALPFSGTSNASNNLLYIENTAPISNFSTIYGKTNSSATTAGIYGLAASTASTNNTAGVRGQNNSANSFGYGVEGIHTGGGAGGYFSSSNGAAIITGIGNVGIGTTTPTLGGLVVNRKVGAINAIFGSNTTGVAIETDYPGIGLNTYYNNGRKMINTGFGALMGLNPNTGTISVYNTATSITGQGTAAPLNERLTILANGNVGIDAPNPSSKLEVIGNNNTQTGYFGQSGSGNAVTAAAGSAATAISAFSTSATMPVVSIISASGAPPLKIVDGNEANGKVLSSDANGNATWQSAAYGNLQRFQFKLVNSIVSTNYNFGNASVSGLGSDLLVTINTPGLYHFDVNAYGCAPLGDGQKLVILNIYMVSDFNYLSKSYEPPVSFSGGACGSIDKSFDLYLPVSSTIAFEAFISSVGENDYSIGTTVIGHKIAD
jgi:hypothetical protein